MAYEMEKKNKNGPIDSYGEYWKVETVFFISQFQKQKEKQEKVGAE